MAVDEILDFSNVIHTLKSIEFLPQAAGSSALGALQVPNSSDLLCPWWHEDWACGLNEIRFAIDMDKLF